MKRSGSAKYIPKEKPTIDNLYNDPTSIDLVNSKSGKSTPVRKPPASPVPTPEEVKDTTTAKVVQAAVTVSRKVS